jgi:hypothetical protein
MRKKNGTALNGRGADLGKNTNGFCFCGCGEMAPIYTSDTHLKRGIVKGERARFIRGHNGRKRPFEFKYNQFVNAVNHAIKVHAIDLSYEDFLVYTKTTTCHYCGEFIDWENNVRYNLDRKDNEKGYSKENCVVCCKFCNWLKGNKFTYEEFILLVPALRQIKEARKVKA